MHIQSNTYVLGRISWFRCDILTLQTKSIAASLLVTVDLIKMQQMPERLASARLRSVLELSILFPRRGTLVQ